MTDNRPKRIDLTDTTEEHVRTLVHLLGYHGDDGENESVLSVAVDLSPGGNFPVSGRIFVGTPQKSPLLDGYFPDLGAWACSPDAADRLAAELGAASSQARAAIAPEQRGAARIPALWFTSKGCGPDEMSLELLPLKELRDGADLVAPATLGLMVRAGKLVILGADLIDGGFLLARQQVEQLHRGLGAWLAANSVSDAPSQADIDAAIAAGTSPIAQAAIHAERDVEADHAHAMRLARLLIGRDGSMWHDPEQRLAQALLRMQPPPAIADKYTYGVIWSNEDHEHVGLCAEFPSLSYLAPSVQGAINGIMALVGDVLTDMTKSKEAPPEPASEEDRRAIDSRDRNPRLGWLAQKIKERFPLTTTENDPPVNEGGVEHLDIRLGDRLVVVEYRAGLGFRVYLVPEAALDGAFDLHLDREAALACVVRLLEGAAP